MIRQLAFLMRASKGGLTHEIILRLSWRQFQVYLDSFTWLLNEESDDGRADNRKADMQAATEDPVVRAQLKERKQRMIEETKRKARRGKLSA